MTHEADGDAGTPRDDDPDQAMRVARFRRADVVFDAILEHDPADREAFLRDLCGSDQVLRTDVERLLRAHEEIGSVLDTSAASFAAPVLDGDEARAGGLVSRYRLIRPLGRGGMGEVWLATDAQLDRDVAIKIIRDSAERLGDRTVRVRAIREARAVAKLDHPNVAGIYDVGETPAGALWFAMPFCSGGSLSDRLRDGPLAPADVMQIGAQLASALAAAHARGIVHRDVKPDNALIDSSGHVRLSDFGIAKLADGETAITRGVIGTLPYVSPEQIGGEPVTIQSDLWALGVTLFELSAGYRPFAGQSDAALLHAILSGAPAPLPDGAGLPPRLVEVITALLQKDPAHRPSSADDVANRLLAVDDVRVTPLGGAIPVPAAARRRGLLLVGCGIAAVVAIGAVLMRTMRPDTQAVAMDTTALPSVAVLPFENTSQSAADEPFVDGLTEEVITVLGRAPGLRVSSRTSTFALRGKGLSTRQLADTLGVDHLLEASVRRDGEQVRVTARLVQTSDGSIRWSGKYDRQLRDIFTLQGELAAAIATALHPQLSGAPAYAPTLQKGTKDLVAYEQFLEARYLRAKRTPEQLRTAVGLLQRAIMRDSSFARAWGALATTYVIQSVFAGELPQRVMPAAREAALRAIAIDSTVSEGFAALAHVNLVYDFDWRGVEARTTRAILLDPANETVRMVGALALLDTRRLAAARDLLREARARAALDPGVLATLGRVELEDGRVDESIALFEQLIAMHPTFAYGYQQHGYALLAAKRTADALTSFRTAAALSGVTDSAHLAHALAVTGNTATARLIVRHIEQSGRDRPLPILALAAAHAGLGNRDRAFALLEQAWTERASYLDGVAVMPALKSLAVDPRWQPFLARMGLSTPLL